MKGFLPSLVRWARHAGTRDFYPALVALVSPVQNIFSSPYTLCVPIAQQSGQAVVQGRLSLNVCLWRRVRGRGEPIWTTVEKAWHSVYSEAVTFEKYHSVEVSSSEDTETNSSSSSSTLPSRLFSSPGPLPTVSSIY
jgi:hypothetical protein